MAYQLDRPETGDGLVVALKRPLSGFTEALLPLHGLQPAGRYEITNLDTAERQTADGSALMSEGLRVRLEGRPAAALLHYKR
jgi:alpha-galactosidase